MDIMAGAVCPFDMLTFLTLLYCVTFCDRVAGLDLHVSFEYTPGFV